MNFTYPKNFKALGQNQKEEWLKIKTIAKELANRYKITSPKKAPCLSNFHLFMDKFSPEFIDLWKVTNASNFSFKLCLVEFNTIAQEVNSHSGGSVKGVISVNEELTTQKYFFGFLNFRRDFGRTLIRPETFVDKITELFTPVEIDIKGYKKFSSKYYVLSNDKEKFLNSVSKELLDFLTTLNGFQIELDGSIGLFRLDKPTDLDQTISLCEIGFQLDRIINKIPYNKI